MNKKYVIFFIVSIFYLSSNLVAQEKLTEHNAGTKLTYLYTYFNRFLYPIKQPWQYKKENGKFYTLNDYVAQGNYTTVAYWLDAEQPYQYNNKTHPLHTAVQKGFIDITQLILQKINPVYYSYYVDYPDIEGKTPLHKAAEKNFATIFKVLIEKKANVAKCCGKNRNALWYAANAGNHKIVKIILANNPYTKQKLMSQKSNKGTTAVQVGQRHPKVKKLFQQTFIFKDLNNKKNE